MPEAINASVEEVVAMLANGGWRDVEVIPMDGREGDQRLVGRCATNRRTLLRSNCASA